MQIISRARWGARYERGFRDAPLPAEEAWLHHSVTIAPDLRWIDADGDNVDDDEERAMRLLEQIGEDRFGGGISYTWLVMPSGRIYDGHGVERQGAHTGGRNDRARAICLVGDYSTRAPTAAQKRSVAWLLQEGKRRGWLRHARLNGGHRQAPGASTACPGDAAFRTIAEINRLAAGPPITDAPKDDDMELTTPWDDEDVNARPNTFGHAMLNVKQNAAAARTQTTTLIGMVRALQGDVSESEARIVGAITAQASDMAELAAAMREHLDDEQVGQLVDELTGMLEAQSGGPLGADTTPV